MTAGTWAVECRSCGSTQLEPVLDLGETPVANALVAADELGRSDDRYPLGIVFCRECALVQLTYSLPADVIFGDDYPYYSSFSDHLCEHARQHVEALIERRSLGPDSLVVEVASNDGYLLRNVVSAGVRALGIDPAPGPVSAAIAAGVPTQLGFFGVDVAKEIVATHGRADVIIANNVMAHVPNLNDFVAGFAELLADDGVLTIENPWVRDLVEHVEFDQIYHEHYCYYSCSAVDSLMQRHGLHLNDVEYFPDLHGGTLRWYVGARQDRTAKCQGFLDEELELGMTTAAYYLSLAARVQSCQDQLLVVLRELRDAGRVVAAYGAAAKGATLLNSTGIDTELLRYVVDRNVHKQGKYLPGCRLPIVPVEVLLESPPDDVLILAWNFADEIVRQQAQYVEQGGTFYVPVPVPRKLER